MSVYGCLFPFSSLVLGVLLYMVHAAPWDTSLDSIRLSMDYSVFFFLCFFGACPVLAHERPPLLNNPFGRGSRSSLRPELPGLCMAGPSRRLLKEISGTRRGSRASHAAPYHYPAGYALGYGWLVLCDVALLVCAVFRNTQMRTCKFNTLPCHFHVPAAAKQDLTRSLKDL